MSRICTKLASKLFANKSKVHFMQPKSINLYFKNAQKPEFKFINLNNVSSIDFNIDTNKDSSSLIAKVVYKNGNSAELLVSTFDNYEDAVSALDEVRVKLYSPSNSIVKHFITLMVAMLFIVMIGDFSAKIRGVLTSDSAKTTSVSESDSTVQQATPIAHPNMEAAVMNPSANVAPKIGTEDIDSLISQLQQVKSLQAEQQQLDQQPTPVEQEQQVEATPELSPSDKLLKGLN